MALSALMNEIKEISFLFFLTMEEYNAEDAEKTQEIGPGLSRYRT